MVMDNKDIQQKQIETTSQICVEFERDSDSAQEKINILRQMLRMKEDAARRLEEFFYKQIMPLRRIGISGISVLGIAEALEHEILTTLGEMQVIADRLAIATHINDIRDGYDNIANNITDGISDTLQSLRADKEEAVNSEDALQRIEWADTWDNLNPEYKQRIV
jgi:hypothetical protein